MTRIRTRLPVALFAYILCTAIPAVAQAPPADQCPGQWVNRDGTWWCSCPSNPILDFICEQINEDRKEKAEKELLSRSEPERQQVPKLGLNIRAAEAPQKGVLIYSVSPDSEAEAKGIRPGSLITSVHGSEVLEPSDVVENLARAYRDGLGAVLMRIDGAFIAIPFPDRKSRPLAKEKPPVLVAEPKAAIRPPKPKAQSDPPTTLKDDAAAATGFGATVVATIRNLPTSTYIAGGIAVVLALALAALTFRRRTDTTAHNSPVLRDVSQGREGSIRDKLLNSVPFAPLIIAAWRSGKAAHEKFIEQLRQPPKHIQLLSPDERNRRAQQHLQNAMTYFDKWLDAKDWNDKRNFVRFAAQQIEQAKMYDHTATFSFLDENKQPDTWDIRQFAATTLFYQAQNLMNDRFYGRAATVLRRALEFDPDNTQYLNKLAETYIRGKRRRQARAVLEGVQYPDFRTQELLDRLNADWLLGFRLGPNVISFLLGAALLYAAYTLFDKTQWSNWAPIILALLGAVCLWNAQQGSIEDTLKRQGKWPGKTRADHEL